MPEHTSRSVKCPECGVDLTNKNKKAHAFKHWPENIKDQDLGKDAVKRRKKLLEG